VHQRNSFRILWLACGLALLAQPLAAQILPVFAPAFAPAAPGLENAQKPEKKPAAARKLETKPAAAPIYVPITGRQRVGWVFDGIVGVQSLGVGVIASAWDTAINSPEEWQRSWSGFGKRYLQREADVAISSSIEAGVGAVTGEDPRYIPSHRGGVWPRARYAMKTVLLAPRHDDRLAPAWGRVAGNVFNNLIENTWLPPSATTGSATTWRVAGGFAGRLIGNLWGEFWPDVRKRLGG
jgi:hypothetical protein